jgi:hypothetical protein
MSKSNKYNRLPQPLNDLVIKKFDKSEVAFELKAKGHEDCDECQHFAQGAGCYLVKGLVTPESWCNRFKRNPKFPKHEEKEK